MFEAWINLHMYVTLSCRYKMLCEETWPSYRTGTPKEGIQAVMKVSDLDIPLTFSRCFFVFSEIRKWCFFVMNMILNVPDSVSLSNKHAYNRDLIPLCLINKTKSLYRLSINMHLT